MIVTNKCLMIKNWNQKYDPILKLRVEIIYEVQEKSKKGRNRQEVEWSKSTTKGWTHDHNARRIFSNFIKNLCESK